MSDVGYVLFIIGLGSFTTSILSTVSGILRDYFQPEEHPYVLKEPLPLKYPLSR